MHNVFGNLLEIYGQWIQDRLNHGWNGYLATITFKQLPGSDHARLEEMKKQISWFYGRLAQASVPKPSRPQWVPFLPQAVFAPDLPVPKRAKQPLKNFVVNNGLHWHGLILTNPLAPGLKAPLDVHVRQNMGRYLVGGVKNIDVRPIKSAGECVTDYALKAVKRRVFSHDDILLFPRSLKELPCLTRKVASKHEPTYAFQRE